MKKLLTLMAGYICIFVLFVAFETVGDSGLIEPTRTLKGPAKEIGKLSVFSEPPGLEVVLDGQTIGKTPVIARDLKSGSHVLRIKNSETKIIVTADKPMQLSWYKGSFIQIPKKKEVEPDRPGPHPEKEKAEPEPEKQNEKKEKLDPFYWPLNPSGPIY